MYNSVTVGAVLDYYRELQRRIYHVLRIESKSQYMITLKDIVVDNDGVKVYVKYNDNPAVQEFIDWKTLNDVR